MLRHSVLLALALAAVRVAAQTGVDEEGRPFSTRFGWDDYRAHNQNWAVAQLPNGRMVVANTWGVLEYDGADWRLLRITEEGRPLVRSLAVARDGALYVGGIGELGRLVVDSTDTYTYESLVHLIPARFRDVDDVWSTHATEDGVVFQTPKYLYRWTGRSMQVWGTPTSFHLAFEVDGGVYVREEGVGLKQLVGDRLVRVPGGEAFADRRVFSLMPDGRGLLAAVRDEGLWRVQDGRAEHVESPASAYLAVHRPYGGFQLPLADGRAGEYAVATFGGGVVVFDANGRLNRVLAENVGLEADDWVLGLAPDDQGGLWMALTDGIVRTERSRRLTSFGAEAGLTGEVYTITRHAGTLFVGTTTGLFELVPGRRGVPGEGAAYAHFEQILPAGETDLSQTWDLLSAGDDLLVAANAGTFAYRDGRLSQLTTASAFRLAPAGRGGEQTYVGEKDRLVRLGVLSGRWREVGAVATESGRVSSIQPLPGGDVWIGGLDGGVVRLRAGRALSFGDADGLSPGPATVFAPGGRLHVMQQAGVRAMHVRDERPHFVVPSDSLLGALGGEFSLYEGHAGRQWVYQDEVLTSYHGGRPVRRVRLGRTQVETLYEEPSGVLWIGSNDGLYRYDPRAPRLGTTFPAFVRRVTDEDRVTLYGGAPVQTRPGRPALTLPYATNSLRFEFAAAAYDRPAETVYQFRLDGRDDAWGPWGPERVTNYTDLWEGTYTFRVRARDANGAISEQAVYTVRILPPWYRTVWAILAYFGLGVGLIWGLTAWRVRQHQRRLEAQRARNTRLQRLGERLRETNARLRDADKLKDDLLANTSHELRTPLTAILGFSEMLADEVTGEPRDLALGIQRGGQRLLGTVNGLLDMYKLQSGTLEILPQPLDVAAVARETLQLLAPIARDRGLALSLHPDGHAVRATADRAVVERLLTNLVGNALKFTDQGGVAVLVDADADHVHLTVRDTGVGIPPDMVARVFEPFEQVSTGHGRSHEGTGLGLAIVRRLVDLTGDDIQIESTLGVGTTVRVSLPRTAAPDGARAAAPGVPHPTLAGLHLLGLCLPRDAVRHLRALAGPGATVMPTDLLSRALREARRTAFDVVLVAADSEPAERKRTRAFRRTPGYATTPLVRVGGDPLPPDELRARGFTSAIALPLDEAALLGELEAALSRVESEREAEAYV